VVQGEEIDAQDKEAVEAVAHQRHGLSRPKDLRGPTSPLVRVCMTGMQADREAVHLREGSRSAAVEDAVDVEGELGAMEEDDQTGREKEDSEWTLDQLEVDDHYLTAVDCLVHLHLQRTRPPLPLQVLPTTPHRTMTRHTMRPPPAAAPPTSADLPAGPALKAKSHPGRTEPQRASLRSPADGNGEIRWKAVEGRRKGEEERIGTR
jgi:hypothetical protein